MNTHRTPKEPRNLFGLFGKNGLTGTCDGAFQLTIKEIVNLLKITGVAGIFGNPGGGDTPEYDYSSGTDFTSGDGWPPDGSIDFAPWRAQQNDNTNNIENGNISNSDNSSNNSKVDYSPDLISGDFHLTSVWVAGGTFSKNLDVIVKGNSIGLYPTTTGIQDRFGVNIDWGFGISISKYFGVSELNQQQLYGNINQLAFGNLGLAYAYNNGSLQWLSISYSFGFGFGASWGYGWIEKGW